MTYPRACALADVLWSPQDKRDWHDFTTRLRIHFNRLDTMNINYFKDAIEQPEPKPATQPTQPSTLPDR